MLKKIIFCIASAVLLMVIFQNCSSSLNSADTIAPDSNNQNNNDNNADTTTPNNCTSLAGSWTTSPTNQNSSDVEILTVTNQCVVSSKLCGGTTTFSSVPNHSGSEIQGSISIQVSGSNNAASCIPDGNYNCNYNYGPSSTIDIFSVRCNNHFDAVYYRQSQFSSAPVIPAGAKIIYYTALPVVGNFGGIAQADSICMSDLARPARVASAKAMLVNSSGRTACTSENCFYGQASDHKDWVLKPSTLYVRSDGTRIGVTSTNSIFQNDLENSISASPVPIYAWSGLSTDWVYSGNSCGNWTMNYVSAPVSVGLLTAKNASFYRSPYPSGHPCTNLNRIICVEQ